MRVEQLSENVKMILGDAREVVPSLGLIDSLVTDPPYGMAFRSNYRKERHLAIQGDDDLALLVWAASLETRFASYVFCRWDMLPHLRQPKSCVTWIKNNWSMGDLNHEHARQTEIALFYPGPDHFFPTRRPTDAITVARTGNDNHPTEKPVDLMRAFVSWTSGVVLDPFSGSGSTGVAAARLGRAFTGIEIHKPYFDIACRRIADELKRPDLFVTAPRAVSTGQEALL